MRRWERSHGYVGVNAPSWLTFEVHRPYFDGAASPLTAIQARGPVVAAALFADRDPATPRLSMTMPASYRQLLTEESRLAAYRVTVPTDLPAALATPAWTTLAEAFGRHRELDPVDRAGLAQWLVAACLPDAVTALVPADHGPDECADPLLATLQLARAIALFQRDGLTERTRAARQPLLDAPSPSRAQLNGVAGWAYVTSRHGTDDSAVAGLADRARRLFDQLAPEMGQFEQGIRQARLAIRETMQAERQAQFDRAADLLDEAGALAGRLTAGTPAETELVTELRRRVIDRGVEIAVRRGDQDSEQRLVAEGLALDPYCVKMRMQAAQAAQRRGDLAGALAGYLHATRLGPFGTAFALTRAAECAAELDRPALRRVLRERAFRAAPRSAETRDALLAECAGDEPMAAVVRAAAPRRDAPGHENNWHYQMYAAYFNLGESRSPCLYAKLPTYAYDFVLAGARPRIGQQRVMPPAFRVNLIREAGLPQFAARHPGDLPKELWTPAWEQLCAWTAELPDAEPDRQYLTMHLLFRVGFQRVALELVPERPLGPSATPVEFKTQAWRTLIGYAAAVGSRRPEPPLRALGLVERDDCPLDLRMTLTVFGVVFHARETKSLPEAQRWRAMAQDSLDTVLASDDYTPFEKAMVESRFYRGVSFVPFMRRDRAGVIAELDRAEELARSAPTGSPWEEFVKRENLHACLESRSKEAFGLGEVELGHRRTEEFLALDPYDPKSHIEHGESLMRQERFVEAAGAYLTAARLGPLGTAIGYAMAGECYERAGLAALAEDCFVQALRLDPYAISAARGWRRVAGGLPAAELATGYADELEAWGAART